MNESLKQDTPIRPRVAVFFYRLGPYHYARLCAAAQRLDVIAVEYTTEDAVYDWEKVTGANDFQRIVLFPGERIEVQSSSKIYDRVVQVLDQLRPNVVALAGWSDRATMASLCWCRQADVPAIVMSETTAWDYTRTPIREAIKRHVVGQFSAGLVGGVPQKDYLAALGLPLSRIHFGYDAVDNKYFATEVGRLKELEDSCLASDPSTILGGKSFFLASARFVVKKNLPFLLRSFARYRKKAVGGDLWDLVIIGDGALRVELEELRKALGLEKAVHLPGFIQYRDLPRYYAAAGVFIHASSSEQWGLVVNEAMASGLPVLVSKTCGCAMDLVKEGVNGYTFTPTDIIALSGHMQTVASVDFPRDQFAAASRRIIAAYGTDAFAGGLEAAVSNALGSRKKRLVFFYGPWITSLPEWPRQVQNNWWGIRSGRTGARMLLFSYRERPVLAFPELPAWGQVNFISRYKSHTPRRFLVRQLLLLSARIGLSAAIYRKIDEHSPELLPFNFSVWKQKLAVELDLDDLMLMVVWPAQLERRRYYFHVLDRDLQPRAFVKIAFLPADVAALSNEHRLLHWNDGARPNRILTPRQIAHGTFEGGLYTIQEAIPSSAQAPVFKNDSEIFDIVKRWSGPVRVCSGADIRATTWWKSYELCVVALGTDFHSKLCDLINNGALMCRVHGDFSRANMLADGNNLWLYDWEHFHESGPAVTDVIGYFLSAEIQPCLGFKSRFRRFANKFLQANRKLRRVDVMLALAFRLSWNFKDTAPYIQQWAQLSRYCHD